MEVYVYLSLDAKRVRKSVFGRVVACPDAFDIRSFVNNMKAIFGEGCVIEVIIV